MDRAPDDGARLRQDEVSSLSLRFTAGICAIVPPGGGGPGRAGVDAIVTAHDGQLDATARHAGGLDVVVRCHRR